MERKLCMSGHWTGPGTRGSGLRTQGPGLRTQDSGLWQRRVLVLTARRSRLTPLTLARDICHICKASARRKFKYTRIHNAQRHTHTHMHAYRRTMPDVLPCPASFLTSDFYFQDTIASRPPIPSAGWLHRKQLCIHSGWK